MKMGAVQVAIDSSRVSAALEEARAMLDKADGELVLDLTTVPRLSARDLRALEELATVANDKGVRIVLHSVGSSLYKVLKLTKLSSRFGFAN
jgi:anti-anti-sigma regulatory factor